MTNNILLLPHYLQTYAFIPSSSFLPQPLLPSTSPPPLPLLPTHTSLTTEAVVLFDYRKKHDNELSLKMGDVITDVEQVCEPHIIIHSSKLTIYGAVPWTQENSY